MREAFEPAPRLYCNKCLQETKHELLFIRTNQVDNTHYEITFYEEFRLLACCGCEDITLVRGVSDTSDPEPECYFYPPRASRALPRWNGRLPSDFRKLLSEIYAALHADSRQLAIMGARALIEQVMIENIGGDMGFFGKNLRIFQEKGYLTPATKVILESALEAGHASMHRGRTLKTDEAFAVVEIIENMLHSIYVLPNHAEKLMKSIPPRKP